MARKMKTVQELLKNLGADDEFRDQVKQETNKQSLATFLMALRCHAKLSQKDMADKMNCSQSKISKIESSYNEQISVGDLMAIGKVLNLQLGISYRSPQVKIIDLIKYHMSAGRALIKKLVGLADDDASMSKGIKQALARILTDNLTGIMELLEKLEDSQREMEPCNQNDIHLSLPLTNFLG